MAVTTLRGIIRSGKVEPLSPFGLPEGSEVYVVVPVGMTMQAAKCKANAWLVGSVGNLLLADKGDLMQIVAEWVWRFEVYITSPAHEPWGPIDVLDPEQTKASLYARGQTYSRPL